MGRSEYEGRAYGVGEYGAVSVWMEAVNGPVGVVCILCVNE